MTVDLVEASAGNLARHPWESARLASLARIVAEEVDLGERLDWLDVGSGDAWLGAHLLELLPPGSTFTCFDVNYTKADIERIHDMGWNVNPTSHRPNTRFDVISMFDVIEHVEDDRGFLRDVVMQHMASGAVVLVTVPAYQILFTNHDARLMHFRRYSRRDFHRIEPPQLNRVREGGLFLSLLPVRLAKKLLEVAAPTVTRRRTTGVGKWTTGRVITSLLTRLLTLDARLSILLSRRGWYLPGLTHWAVYKDAAA